MPYELDDATANRLLTLHPWALGRAARPVHAALDALLEAEAARRGHPEPTTGAFSVLALTQGSLLKEEYDLDAHGHTGWRVGAVVADVKEMTLVNQRFGFAVGDGVLRATASALAAHYPGAKVVRLHPDAFVALLGPVSGLAVSEAQLAPLRERLARDTRSALPASASEGVAHTLALLELSVHSPSHWQVLGPLVWAECERAFALERLGRAGGTVQRRALHLDGALPPAP